MVPMCGHVSVYVLKPDAAHYSNSGNQGAMQSGSLLRTSASATMVMMMMMMLMIMMMMMMIAKLQVRNATGPTLLAV